MRHTTDYERMLIGKVNRQELIIKETTEELDKLRNELYWTKELLKEKSEANKQLCRQVNYLFSKERQPGILKKEI